MLKLPAQPDVLRRRADHDAERAGLDRPVQILVEHAQVVTAQLKRDLFSRARLEVHAAESLQLHDGPRD